MQRKRILAARFVGNDRNKTRLEERHSNLKHDIDELEAKITETLPRIIPLLGNQPILKNVKQQLDSHLQVLAQHQQAGLKFFLNGLPDRVFSETPLPPVSALRMEQESFYRKRLSELCDSYLNGNTPKGYCNFEQIPQERAEQLQQLIMNGFLGKERVRHLQNAFQELQQQRSKLADLRNELDNLVEMPPSERRVFEELSHQEEQMKEEKSAQDHNKKDVQRDLESTKREIDKLGKDIQDQEHRVKLSRTASMQKDSAEKLKVFFREYKEELKKLKRESLEEAINKYFQTLMSSHHLIARIQVDETFGLHYLDDRDQPVAMGGISAGMKQLVATALLWALKDVSGKQLPMVIDTPLARIDMDHQLRLIDQYYPQVARQVILLPTDSEIDELKHARLKPYVYREYRLVNPDGRSTSFETGSWWAHRHV